VATLTADRVFDVFARDLVDAASLDRIRRNALAARFTNPGGI
jgi:hypothetical protein